MRMMNFFMGLFRRGSARRQAIVRLLAQNPCLEYTETGISRLIRSHVGVVHADMATLEKSGHASSRTDGDGRALWRYNYGHRVDDAASEGVPA